MAALQPRTLPIRHPRRPPPLGIRRWLATIASRRGVIGVQALGPSLPRPHGPAHGSRPKDRRPPRTDRRAVSSPTCASVLANYPQANQDQKPLENRGSSVRPLLDSVADSTIDTLDPDCLAAWTPLPWLGVTGQDPRQDPAGAWVRAFGPVGTALAVIEALSPAADQPDITVGAFIAARTGAWSHDLHRVRASGRLTVPWAPGPAFARPRTPRRCGYKAALYWLPPDTAAHAASDPLEHDALPSYHRCHRPRRHLSPPRAAPPP
jgi:hypothetical protein